MEEPTSVLCSTCGAPVDRQADVCGACGTPVDGAGRGRSRPGPRPSSLPPPPPPPAWSTASPGSGGGGLDTETRNWAVAAHLAAFLGAAVTVAFVGPLVVWLVKRDEHPFVAEHAREALNFNLTMYLGLVAAFVVGFVTGVLTIGLSLIVIAPALIGFAVAWFILTIIAAIRASNGETYRYPFSLRLVK